jgi:hypothetical protein
VQDSTGFSPFFLLHGQEARRPNTLDFAEEPERHKYVEGYVQEVHENLKHAFELARHQQYAAAVGNRDNAAWKTKPDFKVGDLLYLWEHTTEMTGEAAPETASRGVVPRKWTHRFSGPFRMLRWISPRTVELDYHGRCTEYNVNRLTKHVAWDSVNPDTLQWCLENRRGGASSAPALEDAALQDSKAPEPGDPVPIPADFQLQPDELFLFPMAIDEENRLPFGIGKVLIHEKGKPPHFQWLGNHSQKVNGRFEPAWFQPKGARHYYKAKREHPSHTPYTGADLATLVKLEDCLLVSSRRSFLTEGKLDIWARNYIYGHEDVKQALEEAALERPLA